MANIDDLNYASILGTTDDEGLELLRQIRMKRRVVDYKPKKVSATKKMKTPDLTPEQAAAILKLLEGDN